MSVPEGSARGPREQHRVAVAEQGVLRLQHVRRDVGADADGCAVAGGRSARVNAGSVVAGAGAQNHAVLLDQVLSKEHARAGVVVVDRLPEAVVDEVAVVLDYEATLLYNSQ